MILLAVAEHQRKADTVVWSWWTQSRRWQRSHEGLQSPQTANQPAWSSLAEVLKWTLSWLQGPEVDSSSEVNILRQHAGSCNCRATPFCSCRATPCRKLQFSKPDDRTNEEKSSLIQFPFCVTDSHSIEIVLHFNLGDVLPVFLSSRLVSMFDLRPR